MEKEHFYHMFANGDDAKNFITSESEFKAAFNRFGVCVCIVKGVIVISFSVEDSHPHALLWGTYEACVKFKCSYESITMRYIARNRGSSDGVNLQCEIEEVTDESYLMNVGAYTIVQATKDGKAIMPYDYRYGTGALYFRSNYSFMPWLIDENGNITRPVTFGSLTLSQKRRICASRKYFIPDDWLVCNGFILPENYVDVARFEEIYHTHNCFRAFLASKKSSDQIILTRMSEVRGVMLEDLEARRICEGECIKTFGKRTARHLNLTQRIILSQNLRRIARMSYRQISAFVRIPELELRKWVK